MATIGQQLLAPEIGWQRIDNAESHIVYNGTWSSATSSNYYSSTLKYSPSYGRIISFKFYGTKLRIIAYAATVRDLNVIITIDGTPYTYSECMTNTYQSLVYEKVDLNLDFHLVTITKGTNDTSSISLDAIDIDDTGYLTTLYGISLITPETGWRRYDNDDSRVKYIGNWNSSVNASNWNGGSHVATSSNLSSVSFKFYGTKLRIITPENTTWSTNVKITLDNIDYYFNEYSATLLWQVLVFEKVGLTNGIHTVTISSGGTGVFGFDCFDIDSTGYLLHPILNQVQDINSMQVGDCIPCRYTATTSGSAGTFSELGTCIANEIPIAGTATPNGLFYFIKTKKGTLIADRVIQTGISWNVLNTASYIEGKVKCFSIIPDIYSFITVYGTVTDNGKTFGGYYSYKIFTDDDFEWLSTIYGTVTTPYPAWVNLELNSPIKFNEYAITCGQFSNKPPTAWILEIYDLETNTWVTIDTKTNISFSMAYETKKIKLNKSYLISKLKLTITNGNSTQFSLSRILLFNNESLIRSLSGGVAYLDSSGTNSTTDKGLGGWPPTNEWDQYIVKSDLNGNIVAGDNNVWHWNDSTAATWCKDTTLNQVVTPNTTTNTSNTCRTLRSKMQGYGTLANGLCAGTSSAADIHTGFRPVLEYLEQNSKATTLYY